jgi:hypothetical protein
MKVFRKLRIFALLFAVLALVLGFAVLNAPGIGEVPHCCWVLYCTIDPPIVCWEECRPCPSFPQQITDEPGGQLFRKE